MAYSNFIPGFNVQESQDAQQIKIWDDSVWNGESGFTTTATVQISYYDDNGVLVTLDDYELITGMDATKFNEYLDKQDGHIIDVADLTLDGVSIGDRLPEAYFKIKILYSNGDYAVGEFPYYINTHAFLAKYRFMLRRLPAALLLFPMTSEVFGKNRDAFVARLFMEACENAADYGKHEEFIRYLALIKSVFDTYAIESPW